MTATAGDVAEAVPDISPGRRTTVLASMCLALTLVIAGVTMLVNALPMISDDLGLSQATQTWVVDAYALPFAALLLIAGALGDRYGRRGALLTGTAIYGLSVLLAATAGSGSELLAYRALTGVGAALIMPGTLSTLTSVFPADQRARAVGIWSGFAMGGGTLGLLGSGVLLARYSWQSIFVVAAVLALVAFVTIALAVPSTRATEHVSLDPGGTLLSALAVGGLVLGIIEAPEQGWASPSTLAALAVGGLGAAAFVWWELRVDDPLLDPRLFRLRGFGTGAAALFLMFLAIFGSMLLTMQYLQLMLGYSPLRAAVACLPQVLVMMPLAAVAASLSARIGHRRLTTAGLLIGAVGLMSLAGLDTGSSYLRFLASLLVISVGIGLAMTPATTAIVSSLPLAKQGVASAVNDAAREVGSALGVAVLGSAFNTAYRSAIAPDLGNVAPGVAEGARQSPIVALDSAARMGSAGDGLADAARDAFVSGMRGAVVIAAALLVGGAAYTWLRAREATDGNPADDLAADAVPMFDAVPAEAIDPALTPALTTAYEDDGEAA